MNNQQPSPLRAERDRRGWTREYVAEKIGANPLTIFRIETKGLQSSGTAVKLARLFSGYVTLEQICQPSGSEIESDAPEDYPAPTEAKAS